MINKELKKKKVNSEQSTGREATLGYKELTLVIFTQIKNRFFGNTEFNSPRAPLPSENEKPFVDEMLYSEDVWDNLGEKLPYEEKDIELGYKQKAEILFERLEKEPNPKKFIEIFQEIYNKIYDNLENGLTLKYTGYSQSLLNNKLLYSLEESFDYYGYSDFLKKEKKEETKAIWGKLKDGSDYEYQIPAKYKIEYIGNIFGEKESEKLILDGFKSKKLGKFILEGKKKKKNIFVKIGSFIKNINIFSIIINK